MFTTHYEAKGTCDDRHFMQGIRWQVSETKQQPFPMCSSKGAVQVGHRAVSMSDTVKSFRGSRQKKKNMRAKARGKQKESGKRVRGMQHDRESEND